MRAEDRRIRDLVTQQAAEWLVANREELSSGERENFVRWLTGSPMHVEEYLSLAAAVRDLRDACAELAPSVDTLIAQARAPVEEPTPIGWQTVGTGRDPRPDRWRIGAASWAAAGALCVGVLVWWRFESAPQVHATDEAATVLHFSTRHGEQQTRRLPDDSILHLNTDTSVIVRISAAERLVTLGSGEADFEVTHDPHRPFRVLAGSVQVLDRGTQFDVRMERDLSVITVIEGKVSVAPRAMPGRADMPKDPGRRPIELSANQQLRVAQWPPPAPVAADAHGTTSWLRRQITFEHEPLSRVASEFNRYASKPIEIATPALANLEISGVFATDDPSEFIAFLRTLKGVQVNVTGTRIVVSQH
jgi:transmembrane sensor